MEDPVDKRTPGQLELSDAVSLVVSVVIVLGSLGLDAAGIWTIPQELKMAIIAGAGVFLLGEKAVKAFMK